MAFVGLLIIGAAAGFIATRLMDMETDIITTVSLGVIGSLVGWAILRFLLAIGSWLFGFVGAVIGAMALIWVWQTYIRK